MTAPAYHVTTPGEDVAKREASAQGQDSRVLDFMRSNSAAMFSAWELFGYFMAEGQPIDIGSIRRGLSNWKARGQLIRHDKIYRKGPKGASETYYQYAPDQG